MRELIGQRRGLIHKPRGRRKDEGAARARWAGFPICQPLHFLELLLFYLASLTTPIYLAYLAAALLRPPISDSPPR